MNFGYSWQLALQGLRRYPRTTALAVLTVAIGLAGSMTTLALLHKLSADPLPGYSQSLYLGWVDGLQAKPVDRHPVEGVSHDDFKRMRVMDAEALLAAQPQTMGTLVGSANESVQAGNGSPGKPLHVVLTTANFFPMFGVPMLQGSGWSAADDRGRRPQAVIDSQTAQKLFGGTAQALGKSIRIEHRDFMVVGVTGAFAPQPHFYGLDAWAFSSEDHDEVFLPYSAAIDAGVSPHFDDCDASVPRETLFGGDPLRCEALALWVRLQTPAQVSAFRDVLSGYASSLKYLGSFGKKPNSALYSLSQWLTFQHVIPDSVRLNVWLALSFLLLCMVNVAGLLAAKFLRRSNEVGVRRALGARRGEIVGQFLLEALLICAMGAVVALPLTELGLHILRMQDDGYTDLAQLDLRMFGALFLLALVVGLAIGVLPALRMARVQPGLQTKAA